MNDLDTTREVYVVESFANPTRILRWRALEVDAP